MRTNSGKLPAIQTGEAPKARKCATKWFPYPSPIEESGMNKLTVDFENCYGIRKLQYTFDFATYRSFAIYASNGSMKTSLARTLKDYAEGKQSGDLIFTSRTCARKIVDENNASVNPDSVFVILPYDANSHLYEKTSTLLVNKDLRDEYQAIHIELDQSKGTLLDALKKQSGSKRDLEREISIAFTGAEDKFYQAISRIAPEALEEKDSSLTSVPYDTVFEDRVLEFLNNKDVKV